MVDVEVLFEEEAPFVGEAEVFVHTEFYADVVAVVVFLTGVFAVGAALVVGVEDAGEGTIAPALMFLKVSW